MLTNTLLARIDSFRDVDPDAVDEMIEFVRASLDGANSLATHGATTSAALDVFADLDCEVYRDLVALWNDTAPIVAR